MIQKSRTPFMLFIVAFAAMAFTFSCSSDGGDGGTCSANFRTVIIGSQTWMAENLNCDVEGSKCYDNNPSNCETYGRLYNWATAMNLPSNCNSSSCSSQIQSKHRGICPAGWHIPSRADWEAVTAYISSTDDYGFSVLPSGFGLLGSFYDGGGGWWWTASEDDSDYYAYYLNIVNIESGSMEVYSGTMALKNMLFSVRCLKD